MGYSLCIVVIFGHFQRALIFRILIIFSSRFLHRTTLISSYKRFSHLFGIFKFWPKVTILHGLSPLHCGHFSPFLKRSHFSNINCFFEAFFAPNNFEVFVKTFLVCFRQFYFFTKTEYFAWAIAFALWPFLAIFKMLSFFKY